MSAEAAPEFSRTIPAAALSAGAPLEGAAKAQECAALAARYSVPAVRALRYAATAAPWGPGGWRVKGVVTAALTQVCVVTLEPVDTNFAEPFERFFAPKARLDEAAGLLDPEGEETVEALGEAIDLGEIAAEAAALAIDPYPRKPEAAFDGVLTGPPGVAPLTDEAARPFAGLATLKGKARDR